VVRYSTSLRQWTGGCLWLGRMLHNGKVVLDPSYMAGVTAPQAPDGVRLATTVLATTVLATTVLATKRVEQRGTARGTGTDTRHPVTLKPAEGTPSRLMAVHRPPSKRTPSKSVAVHRMQSAQRARTPSTSHAC
jgi:hypothetical protein